MTRACEGCARMRRFRFRRGGYCLVLGCFFLRPRPAHQSLACAAYEEAG